MEAKLKANFIKMHSCLKPKFEKDRTTKKANKGRNMCFSTLKSRKKYAETPNQHLYSFLEKRNYFEEHFEILQKKWIVEDLQ